MTHIVTHRKFAVPMPHRIFDYFNAFIGTSDFDEIYTNMILDIVLWAMFIFEMFLKKTT